MPASVTLDESFIADVDEFKASWESLRTCASFRQGLLCALEPRTTGGYVVRRQRHSEESTGPAAASRRIHVQSPEITV